MQTTIAAARPQLLLVPGNYQGRLLVAQAVPQAVVPSLYTPALAAILYATSSTHSHLHTYELIKSMTEAQDVEYLSPKESETIFQFVRASEGHAGRPTQLKGAAPILEHYGRRSKGRGCELELR